MLRERGGPVLIGMAAAVFEGWGGAAKVWSFEEKVKGVFSQSDVSGIDF